MKLPAAVMRAVDRQTLGRTLSLSYRTGRTMVEALSRFDPIPGGVSIKRGKVAGRDSLLVVPAGASEHPRVVWFHGGAFCYNSPRAYATFAGHLAEALGRSVCIPSYRLAPEHPFPAAHHDSLAATRALHARGEPLIVAGDSAGGCLALQAAIALRDAGDPAPAGMLLMSPWVDLTLSGETITTNDGKDAILRAADLPRHVAAYARGQDPGDPRLSPLNADLAGLPPALIQCGSDDLFLSEDTELAGRIEAAGGQVALDVPEGMWHDFQVHAGMMKEAARAVQRMATWAKPLVA